MGKIKGKKGKKSKKNKVKVVLPYTKEERHKKITNIMLEVAMTDMTHVLTQEIKDSMQNFINTGETVERELDLPAYSRVLQLYLVNDKNSDSYIAFKFKKVVVEDGDEKNPINRLNKLQQEIQ